MQNPEDQENPLAASEPGFPGLILERPALLLAPMEGLTDAPMREVQGRIGAFTFGVSEFIRVSGEVLPHHLFRRDVPELKTGGRTRSGLPVQVQLLGGDEERIAKTAVVAWETGARAIDINFGCPAPTVNRHDGGASLLKHPRRIRAIVAAIRAALPPEIPVSAKLRLGWDNPEAIHENAAMAAEGGASWITIHGRTREQGYRPPALYSPIRAVRETLGIPVVANGDLWTVADFRRCRDETGCSHFMLGRSALSNPLLSRQVACELGLPPGRPLSVETRNVGADFDWRPFLRLLAESTEHFPRNKPGYLIKRLKQWLRLASVHGDFPAFDTIKRVETVEELFALLG